MYNTAALSTLKSLRKPHVNSTCIGCSACTAISGDVFEFDDNGLSIVKSCTTYEGMDVDDAISACPVNAISWQATDATGAYTDGVVEHIDVR
jgi:ferredoxin